MLDKGNGSLIIPSLRYENAPAAIEWLCKAFGFKKNAVYANDNGTIAHAQLTLGSGMLMLGSASNKGPFDGVLGQPKELGNRSTQTIYLVVSDCEAAYRLAQAAQAEMLDELTDKSYGGKGFTCRDPEGHIWSVGSYDPWV
jgi:uncharacterized glyoxalase superfamily protein PhnB